MAVGDTFTIGKRTFRIFSEPTTTESLKIIGMIARCTKRPTLDAVVSIGDAMVRALAQIDRAKLADAGSAREVINAAVGAAIDGVVSSTADFMDAVGHEEMPALVRELLKHVEVDGYPLSMQSYDTAFQGRPMEPLHAAREAARALGFFGQAGTTGDGATTPAA